MLSNYSINEKKDARHEKKRAKKSRKTGQIRKQRNQRLAALFADNSFASNDATITHDNKTTKGFTNNSQTNNDSTFLINAYAIIITSSFGVVSNGVLLVVFAVDPLKCLRSVCSGLIINLSAADFLTATMILIWITNHWLSLPDIFPPILFSMIWFGYLASFLTITVLSCERYIAIRYIWSVDRIVTKKRTLYVVGTIWLLSSSTFVHMFIDVRRPLIISLSTVTEICILCVGVFYIKLWHVRRKHGQACAENASALKKEVKLTKVIILLLLILTVTSLPTMILYQIIFLQQMICKTLCLTGDTPLTIPFRLYPIFSLNFGLNPVVYAWRLPKYRRSLKALFSRVFANKLISGFCRTNISKCKPEQRRLHLGLSDYTTASCTSITRNV